jgi:hypothetical protein
MITVIGSIAETVEAQKTSRCKGPKNTVVTVVHCSSIRSWKECGELSTSPHRKEEGGCGIQGDKTYKNVFRSPSFTSRQTVTVQIKKLIIDPREQRGHVKKTRQCSTLE